MSDDLVYHGTAKHCDGIPQLTARIRELEAEREDLLQSIADITTQKCNAEAERDALRRDAERYRWLRQRAAAQDVLLRRALYENELDQAIDALREGDAALGGGEG